jgi:hypothetical protein
MPRGLAAAAAGCEPTPAASAGVGVAWRSATDGATPSTNPIDKSAGDPGADSGAAAEQARWTAAWLDSPGAVKSFSANLYLNVLKNSSNRLRSALNDFTAHG